MAIRPTKPKLPTKETEPTTKKPTVPKKK